MTGNDQTPPTQTVKYTLSPEQQAILDKAMPSIDTFAATTPQRYQDETVAGFTAPEIAGQKMALTAAGDQGTLAANAAGTTNTLLSTDPNARRDDAIAAAVRPIYDNLTQRTLPALRTGSVANGTYGSSRSGIAQGLATEAANRDAGDTAAKLSASIYGTDVDAQLKALGLVPQTQQSLVTPATTTSGVGDVQRAYNQQLIDEAIANFSADNGGLDYAKAQDLVALLGAIPGGGSEATGSVPPTNTLAQVLGGAATGATLGSAFSPLGTAVGGVGGAVLPFLFSRA